MKKSELKHQISELESKLEEIRCIVQPDTFKVWVSSPTPDEKDIEIARLHKVYQELCDYKFRSDGKLIMRNVEKDAKIRKLIEAGNEMIKYCSHNKNCTLFESGIARCNCGYRNSYDKWQAAKDA
jgi:hypothetical protein